MESDDLRDRVDANLEAWCGQLPGVDMDTEGIMERVHHLERYLKKAQEAAVRSSDLTLTEWKILTSLRKAVPDYSVTPGRLAKTLMMSPSTMTARLDRLERNGLVERVPDTSDRRVTHVRMTPRGHETWETALGAQAAKEKEITEPLSPAERQQLNSLLRRVMLAMERVSEAQPKP